MTEVRSAGLPSQKQVIELLDGEFARAGYEIEDVVIDADARPPRITVIADGDDGLDLDSIATLSRSASELLDTADRDSPAPYVLEVTSPGVDRPLTTEKHFRRARGRKVELTLSDGSQLTGRLGETRDGTVVRRSCARAAGANFSVRELPLDGIAKAVVQVEFSPPNQRELELAGQSGKEAASVNIDMAALHAIEADKGISVDVVVDTIKSALLTAYRHTEGHEADARIEIDRKTGVVQVMARETDDDGNVLHEWDDTPEGFGRIAATTARQVILQRLRDAENEKNYGEFSAREGDIVAGVIQRDAAPTPAGSSSSGWAARPRAPRASSRRPSRCPARRYEHGDRLRCYVVGVSRGAREPLITLSRTHPNLVRKLFSLEVPEIADGSVEIVAVAREAGHRSKIAVTSRVPGLNAKGACIGPMGQRVRNVMSELSGEKIDIIDYDEDPARFVANALSPAKVVSVQRHRRGRPRGAGGRARLPAVAGDRQGRPERPAGGPADRLAHRHPQRCRCRRGQRAESGRDAQGPVSRLTAVCGRFCQQELGTVDSAVIQRETSAVGRIDSTGRTGADMRRLPEARAGRRTASGGRCGDGNGEYAVTVDAARNLPGRGAWLHPDPQCLDAAIRRRAFARALRITGSPETPGCRSTWSRSEQHSKRLGTRQQNR